MSRVLSADALLGMIDQMQREFAVAAIRTEPISPHAAQYSHGVYVGMETVKLNILNRMKEEDDREKSTTGHIAGIGRKAGERAY